MNRQLVAFLSLFSLTLVLSVYYVLIPTVSNSNKITAEIFTDSYMMLAQAGKLSFVSEDGLKSLKVIREDAALFSNRLISLSVNKGIMAPKFDPDINEYTVTVTNSTEEIVVKTVEFDRNKLVEDIQTTNYPDRQFLAKIFFGVEV